MGFRQVKHYIDDEFDEAKGLAAREFNVYEGQRPLDPKRLAELKDRISRGVFLDGRIVYCIELWNGKRQVLVNGQCQIDAVIELKAKISVAVAVYECDSIEDVAAVYMQIDPKLGRKDPDDYARVMNVRLGVVWPPSLGVILINANSWLKHGGVSTAVEQDRKQEEMTKADIPVGDFVMRLISHNVATHAQRVPVVAAMINSWRLCADSASGFWPSVIDGAELEAGSVQYMLHKWLVSNTMKTYMQTAARAMLSFNQARWNREQYNRCAVGWNAWRKGLKKPAPYREKEELVEMA